MARWILLAILFVLPPPSHARAELVRNGSFESPRYGGTLTDRRPYYLFTRTRPLDGWTITGSSLAFLRSRPPYWVAADGNQFIELESGYGFAISQTVATTPGARYTIRFAYAPNPDAPGADDALDVLWDGLVVAHLDGSDSTVATLDWQFHEVSVTATRSGTVLRFQDGYVGQPYHGPYLDAVSVMPEPRASNAARGTLRDSLRAMTPSDPADLESRLAVALSALPRVELAYLFGSHARDRVHPESDIDLAIQMSPGAEPRATLAMLFDHLGRVVPSHRLDIVLLDVAPSLLRHRILTTGRLLFERSPLVRVRFVTRTIRDYQDMQLRRAFFLKHRVQRLKQGGTDGGSGDLLAQARRVARLLGEAPSLPTDE